MTENINQLANQIRKDAVASIYHAQSGHPGGVLSCIDILTVLFHQIMTPPNIRKQNYSDDYFILSKGHAAPALYAVAASIDLLKRSELKTLRKLNSKLQGHPDVTHLPWVEISTGSLGQGLSVATGIAKALKLQNTNQQVYSLIGDGEMQEGQVWEAAMFASHHQLNNLTVIVDYNKLQSDASNADICTLEPLQDKWRAFGWHVIEIDGHNIDEINHSLKPQNNTTAPRIIIANTTKGKGVNFMENIPFWHGSVSLSEDQFSAAMKALGCSDIDIKEYY
ncbi:transketolase [Shewanella sp. VB17]|uniref:transketolase n=1 Tax=Shewanella sp. VB17 TaxID=2739432 RepID=UPI0015676645|nr:transketolase [Shewanella sp. VB17]NRD74815.1 transketolase [Shewanella sp. VB17]